MLGTVKTYIPSERNGWILGEDGKFYSFVFSGSSERDLEGASVSFRPTATPEGYVALDVEPAGVFNGGKVSDARTDAQAEGARGGSLLRIMGVFMLVMAGGMLLFGLFNVWRFGPVGAFPFCFAVIPFIAGLFLVLSGRRSGATFRLGCPVARTGCRSWDA